MAPKTPRNTRWRRDGGRPEGGKRALRALVQLGHRGIGFGVSFGAIVLAAVGGFRDPRQNGAPQLLALGGLVALLLARLFGRMRPGGRVKAESAGSDLELGTLFVAAAFVMVEITGGPAGPLYPLVYALVWFLVAFHRRAVATYFLVLILAVEALLTAQQPDGWGWRLYASHASFVLLFGLLHALLFRTNVLGTSAYPFGSDVATRDRSTMLVDAFGLHATSGDDAVLDAQARSAMQGLRSARTIETSWGNVLGVAERALRCHVLAVYWLDPSDQYLQLKAARPKVEDLRSEALPAAGGVLGAVVRRQKPLVLNEVRGASDRFGYYRRPQRLSAFVGVPVRDGDRVRGVLMADRVDPRPFTEGDVATLDTLAAEIAQVVRVERVFVEMERDKFQRERFYEASREFNSALTLEEVGGVAVGIARRVAPCLFASVAVATEEEGMLRLAHVEWSDGRDGSALLNRVFPAGHGLVGAAIKARHPLPHGTGRAPSQPVLGPRCDIDLPQVKVFPLLWKDIGVGALVLGSDQEDFVSPDVIEMLRVIADHAAIAIANAQMYERMERMATTDGLTGLVNHRFFQEQFDAMLARSERYRRKLSLVLADIDHFKRINDTYGHPVGDTVLQRVAATLGQTARRTDVVARYGGEEFAILMEETDQEAARRTAERMRQAVALEVFEANGSSFQCTLSLGVATFDDDARNKKEIIELADQALYFAKRNGRDQVATPASLRQQQRVG